MSLRSRGYSNLLYRLSSLSAITQVTATRVLVVAATILRSDQPLYLIS
jgi:hypothetical protein